jgi:protocatechuate 3,4-dioxygenase beta subunit
MQNPRALGLLVVVALLAAFVCYLAVGGGGDRAPGPGSTGATALEPGGAAVQPAQGQAAPEAQAPDAAAREALVPATDSGPMLVGRVVDENGAPIAGAQVACTAALSADPRDFDVAGSDDPARMLERARQRLSQRREATAGPDGTFRVAAVAGGRTVSVSARARAFQVTTRQAARPTDADVDLGAVVLRRGAVVSGLVVDRANAPVAGAQVSRRNKDEPRGIDGFNLQGLNSGPGAELFELMRGGSGEVTTGADGRFELANAQPGEFALRARHAEHPTLRRDGLTVAPGIVLADVILVLEPGASIAGRLLDVPAGQKELRVLAAPPADTGAPMPPGGGGNWGGGNWGGGNGINGLVTQFAGQFGGLLNDTGLTAERSVAVAADGSFAFAGLAVGRRYRVFATQGGSQVMQPASVCSQRVEVQSGAQGVELHYDPGVQVTAHVVDDRSGAPVETLWVRDQLEGGGVADVMGMMNTRGTRPRSCPGGALVIAGLRPQEKQTLHLVIEAIGYRSSDQKGIALPATGTVDLGVVRLQAVPVVRIQVVAKDGGAPVADASVRLRADRGDGGGNGIANGFANGFGGGFGGGFGFGGGIGTARTDSNGRCTLNALAEGAFVVLVSNKDFAPYASEPQQSKPDGNIDYRAELLHGGAVEVRVVDADGKPVADARVDHAAPGGENDTRQTDGAGSVAFEQLAPGNHRFRLGGTGGGRGGFPGGARGRRNPGDAGPGPGESDWQQLDVPDGERLSLVLSRTPTAALSGIVRENGMPLANARIALLEGAGDAATGDPARDLVVRATQAFGGGRNGRTDDDGRYTLKDLKPGEHRLRVTHDNRSMPMIVRVSLRAGDNVQDVDLDTALLRGTVKDPQGRPVAGATVRVAAATTAGDPQLDGLLAGLPQQFQGGGGGGSEARSGADGRFELRGVQCGVPLIVRAQAKGFAGGASAPVEVGPGSTRDGVDVQVAIGGTVRVRASTDQPFASVIATMQGDEGKGVSPAFAMLNNGTALLEGLKPGRWQVSLRTVRGLRGGRGGRGGNQGGGNGGAAPADPDARTVDVAAGQAVDVVF